MCVCVCFYDKLRLTRFFYHFSSMGKININLSFLLMLWLKNIFDSNDKIHLSLLKTVQYGIITWKIYFILYSVPCDNYYMMYILISMYNI